MPIVAIGQLKSLTDKKKGWQVWRVPNVEKKSEIEKARKKGQDQAARQKHNSQV